MGWVPSGSWTPFPNVQGELPVFREASALGSGSAQASPSGVAGPAQPTEVRLRASVSFALPSSPSPVDPALQEDRDLVGPLRLWTRLSLALSLSFIPIP